MQALRCSSRIIQQVRIKDGAHSCCMAVWEDFCRIVVEGISPGKEWRVTVAAFRTRGEKKEEKGGVSQRARESKFQQVSPQVPILLNHGPRFRPRQFADGQPPASPKYVQDLGEPILRRYRSIFLPETRLIFGRDSWPSYSSILFNLPRYR